MAEALAGRPRGEGDAQAAPVGVGLLSENGDPRVLRHERRQRHAAEPRLVGLERRRAAGERAAANSTIRRKTGRRLNPPRLRAASRLCLARLPHTSISHHRRRLFLLES